MAFFAELNAQNKVLRVMVVGDEHVAYPKDTAAEQWCLENFKPDPNVVLVDGKYPGVAWKQTFTDNTRGKYASIGYEYDPVKDIFFEPKPFPSWTLDPKFGWVSPIAFPTIDDLGNSLPRDNVYPDTLYIGWDEISLSWVGTRNENGTMVDKTWNPATKTWTIR